MLANVLHLAIWRAARPAPLPPPPPPSFTAIRQALARAESLVPRPPPAPLPVPQGGKVIAFRRPASSPPPAPASEPRPTPLPVASRPVYRDEGIITQEINGCKMLLLEIVRRTAYDWILYRSSRRMVQKVLAEQAYRWLFLENPGTTEWNERRREGKDVTSFVSICEALDLDPDKVRSHIRKLTPKNVMSVGRPAEYRKRDVASSSSDDVYSLESGLVSYNEGSPSDDEPFY